MEFKSEKTELLWKNLTLTLPDSTKKLLENVSGSVGPSSMTALMGPSGAGKTTLLNAIAGRLSNNLQLTGEIFLNGRPRNKKTWSRIMGYVEQDFYGYEYQTVYETLEFANKIKGSSNNEEYDNKNNNNFNGNSISNNKNSSNYNTKTTNIDNVCKILGLTHLKNSYISELSGGERKRVSIGVELLGNPPLLFLDEPTSGLDSYNAINILELLKKLTTYGKTILVTIHQPSFKQIEYFSKLLLLSQGNMVYEGEVLGCINWFKSIGYEIPQNTNPTDFFLDLVSIDTRNEQTQINSYNKLKTIKNKWMKIYKQPEIHLTNIVNVNVNNSKIVFIYLLKRNITNYYRKKKYLIIKIWQKIMFLLIFGLAYLRMGYTTNDVMSRRGSFTFLVLNNLFGVCTPIFNSFPEEKRVIVRERRSGMYNGFNAYLSKYISEIPFNLLYEMIYFVCLYWIIGLNPSAGRFFICFIIVFSIVLFALAFGLTVSTMSPAQNIAQIIGSTVILLFTVYSGAFGSTAIIPSWLRWLIYVSPAYYGYTAILQNQFRDTTFYSSKTGNPVPGESLIYQNDTTIVGMWWCILLLWLYTIVWILAGCFIMEIVTRSEYKLEKQTDEDL